ncbi:MAG: TIGR03936 family radical SAM-associated protein [Nitriliruptor sp.]|uniref:TIGR03936 family radical SAM-associated protein n=1 Tax=Nitriliruptor sp. TaxID=2448056 RepID=UPI0034A09418
MQRYRIRWTKVGRVRFVSARDLSSVWERALRRADLPIAYSEGFSPHAKVSFPDALPVGVSSTGEYAELTFAAPIVPARDLGALSATLPEGMDITTYLEVEGGAPKLARMLRATLWELEWPAVDADELTDVLSTRGRQLLDAEHAEVIRHRPDGDRVVDVRPALLTLAAATRSGPSGAAPTGPGGARTVLRAVLRNDGPTVRPTDLLTALATDVASGTVREPDVAPPVITTRIAQGETVDGGLREALSGEIAPLVLDVDAEAA